MILYYSHGSSERILAFSSCVSSELLDISNHISMKNMYAEMQCSRA